MAVETAPHQVVEGHNKNLSDELGKEPLMIGRGKGRKHKGGRKHGRK